jgi:hypothetical protein
VQWRAAHGGGNRTRKTTKRLRSHRTKCVDAQKVVDAKRRCLYYRAIGATFVCRHGQGHEVALCLSIVLSLKVMRKRRNASETSTKGVEYLQRSEDWLVGRGSRNVDGMQRRIELRRRGERHPPNCPSSIGFEVIIMSIYSNNDSACADYSIIARQTALRIHKCSVPLQRSHSSRQIAAQSIPEPASSPTQSQSLVAQSTAPAHYC